MREYTSQDGSREPLTQLAVLEEEEPHCACAGRPSVKIWLHQTPFNFLLILQHGSRSVRRQSFTRAFQTPQFISTVSVRQPRPPPQPGLETARGGCSRLGCSKSYINVNVAPVLQSFIHSFAPHLD